MISDCAWAALVAVISACRPSPPPRTQARSEQAPAILTFQPRSRRSRALPNREDPCKAICSGTGPLPPVKRNRCPLHTNSGGRAHYGGWFMRPTDPAILGRRSRYAEEEGPGQYGVHASDHTFPLIKAHAQVMDDLFANSPHKC